MENPLLKLKALGQSVWLDFIDRELLRSGTLARLIETDGLAGLTSNPTIFAKAIGQAGQYDDAIGVRLTETMLMVPNKSVSGFQFPTDVAFESCELCPREGCPGRRAIYNPELFDSHYCPKQGV